VDPGWIAYCAVGARYDVSLTRVLLSGPTRYLWIGGGELVVLHFCFHTFVHLHAWMHVCAYVWRDARVKSSVCIRGC
jgi:hypothetical protein